MTRTSEAFERLYRENYASVLAYARRRVQEDAVEDVVAQTFTTAWRKLDRIPVNSRPWLLKVANHVIATHYRTQFRRSALLEKLSSVHVEPEVANDSQGLDSQVVNALLRLSPKEREALILVAWDDLSPASAALVVGVTATTLRVRLHRAKAHLRRELSRQQRNDTAVLSSLTE